MIILHVIASMDPQQGGVSQAVRSMIAGLENEQISNEVVSLDAPDQSFLKNKLLPVIHAMGPAKGPWCYNPALAFWLLENFFRFDGIIIHGLWLYPGYAVKKALKQFAKRHLVNAGKMQATPKLFVMPHGMLDPYFQQVSGRKLKALRNKLYWKLIESKIINSSDKVLFTTQEESLLAKDTFSPYKPKAEAVVGLGVDEPPVFTAALRAAFREKCPAIGDSSYLLFLSRIHEKKGLDLLINAYASLQEEKVDSTTITEHWNLPKLIVAGPGLETEYGKKIQSIVAANPLLSKSVIFLGMLTGSAKWGAFYGCEAFVLPSHQENFGIAVVEALACQKPVLISDKINIWREIQTSGSGIIASSTPDGITGLIKTWKQLSQEKRIKMGKNAQALFQTSFAIEAAAKQLAAALQS